MVEKFQSETLTMISLYKVSKVNLTRTTSKVLPFSGVTVLLSLTVYLLMVAKIIPPTSDAVSLIGSVKSTFIHLLHNSCYTHWRESHCTYAAATAKECSNYGPTRQ
ncbi:hypothetical protein CDAR_406591 [Caerostris darwini]|uniref:Uncharacterized protein n=1 Tax=Caerostris darwini TaxID=1538125 RepID=A0AAV4PP23_9ARAC|nr:hypothetical protein CDAR_406591 [Caerostris darwini]